MTNNIGDMLQGSQIYVVVARGVQSVPLFIRCIPTSPSTLEERVVSAIGTSRTLLVGSAPPRYVNNGASLQEL